MSEKPSTGHEGLDFAQEAGPRVLTPDTPEELLKEIGKYKAFSPLREAMRKMKLEGRSKIDAAIRRTYVENKFLAQMRPASSIEPEARIPVDLIHELEAQEKESWNPAMREDTLRCYPGLTLDYWRK